MAKFLKTSAAEGSANAKKVTSSNPAKNHKLTIKAPIAEELEAPGYRG